MSQIKFFYIKMKNLCHKVGVFERKKTIIKSLFLPIAFPLQCTEIITRIHYAKPTMPSAYF